MFEVSSLLGDAPALPEGEAVDRDEEGEMDSSVDMEQSVREESVVRRCSWLSLPTSASTSVVKRNSFIKVSLVSVVYLGTFIVVKTVYISYYMALVK